MRRELQSKVGSHKLNSAGTAVKVGQARPVVKRNGQLRDRKSR